jgi:epoxyqueuosine reductase
LRILLHICCGPCAVMPISALRDEGHTVVGFFHNPNIHPYTEWAKRRDSLKLLARAEDLEMLWDETYGLESFIRKTAEDMSEPGRCVRCYDMRMDRAAEKAREIGADAFSTTLLVSPYQKHDAIKSAMEMATARHGVQAVYRDFRPLFRQGQSRARELGLYMQQYCGCIFSERDRYER